MICPYCDVEMVYLGIDDGGGDYGSAICDQYECSLCGWADEDGCIEYEADDSYPDGQDFEDFYPTEDDPNYLVGHDLEPGEMDGG